ncbi:MAG: tetratricopeptide repeat protein [Alphaproteobacteria bacterium]|nr:tetratricopeptide repeat protein [Alphaproteobacteria bacterium]
MAVASTNAAMDHIGVATALEAAFADGVAAQRSGDLGAAESAYATAHRLAPGEARILANWAEVAAARGAIEDAIARWEAALACPAELAHAGAQPWTRLGALRDAAGRHDEAAAAWREAIRRAPDDRGLWHSLAASLRAAGRYAVAEDAFRQIKRRWPDDSWSQVVLAGLALQRGAFAEALRSFDAAAAAEPANPHVAQARLAFALTDPEETRASLAARHRACAATLARDVPRQLRWRNPADPERPLAVGFLSGDLRNHSVARFLLPMLANRERFAGRTVLYKADVRRDGMTAALIAASDALRSIAGSDDASAARTIGDDGIDVLIDLSGHTVGGRLGVFARQPAPIQLAWIGYPTGTGLDDCLQRVTDAVVDPIGTESESRERLMRLPAPFLCFRPNPDAPAVTPPPSASGASFTFGSFNALHKLTDATIGLWAHVLAAVPRSRLLLKAHGLDDPRIAAAQRARFAAAGLPPDRVAIAAFEPAERDHLARYADMDVALDPTPYAGTTTTCEALWMGVPVVTLCGSLPQARVGASLLGAVGLEDFAVTERDAFVRAAAGLAAAPGRLCEVRASLRERMARSPLCDGARLAQALGDALRATWRGWCAAQSRTREDER